MGQVQRVGLVGAGSICAPHAEALRSIGAELCGVCDLDRARAVELAARFETRAAASLSELCDRGAGAIHVLTPPEAHAEVAHEAIERGCHVLCEKPLATSVEDCRALASAAAERGVMLCCDHSLLFDPHYRRCKQLILAGKIGAVTGVTVVRASQYPPYAGGPLPLHYRSAGHPFRDLGAHALYLVRDLLGPIDDVDASYRSLGGDPNLAYDEWCATVRCRRGLGQLRLSFNTRPLRSEIVVHGEKGALRIDLFAMVSARRPALPLPKGAERALGAVVESALPLWELPGSVWRVAIGKVRPFAGVRALVAAFYQAIESGGPPPVEVEAATEVVRWCEDVARAAERDHQRRVRVSIPAQAAYLVTGASGSLGRAVVERLLARGERVRCFVRRVGAELPNGVDRVVGDLGDPEAVDRAVAGARTVIHCGAAMRGPSAAHACATVTGTRNVIEACLQRRAAKLVHISSMSVLQLSYGDDGAVVSEATPLEPQPELRGDYTQSKLEAERLVRLAAEERGLPAVILRPGQIFGGRIPLVTPAVARRVGGAWLVLGDGRQHLPLVYLDDVVDAVLLAADGPLQAGETIQLTDPEAPTQREVLARTHPNARVLRIPRGALLLAAGASEALLGLFGRRSPLPRYRLRSALVDRSYPSIRAERLLGWRPRVGVRHGIERVCPR